jgi:hypothetical protein
MSVNLLGGRLVVEALSFGTQALTDLPLDTQNLILIELSDK